MQIVEIKNLGEYVRITAIPDPPHKPKDGIIIDNLELIDEQGNNVLPEISKQDIAEWANPK